MAEQNLFPANQAAPLPSSPSTGLALPAPTGFGTVVAPDQQEYGSYVMFLTEGKGKWSDIKAKIPALTSGDAVVMRGGDPTRIVPFTFFLLDVFQYWCQTGGEDAGYKPTRVWTQKPEIAPPGVRLHDDVLSLMLVQHGGELIPATCRLRDGMTQGVHTSIQAVETAATPEWFALSSEHKATAPIPQPNLRFKTTFALKYKKAQSGYGYFTSKAHISPTSLGDMEGFKRLQTDEGRDELNLAVEAFNKHKADMVALERN